MRLARFTLPLGFFVLSSAWVAPLLAVDFSWRSLVAAVLFFGTTGSILSTFAWVLVVRDVSTPARGAIGAMVSNLLAAVCCLPFYIVPFAILDAESIHDVLGVTPTVVLSSMVVGLGALALSPFTAGLGYAVAANSEARLPTLERFPSRLVPSWRPQTRGLAVAFLLLSGSVVTVAGVQYIDPLTSSKTDAPTYAGPGAPAAEQVAQAQARTRATSRTVSVTYITNGSWDWGRNSTLKHDLERDVALVVASTEDGGRLTGYRTVDGTRVWRDVDGERTVERIETSRDARGISSFDVPIALDEHEPKVSERGNEAVTLRYPTAATPSANLDYPDNRTVTIDTATGRVLSVTDTWVDANGDRVVCTYRFTDYETTTVDPPNAPIWSVEWHVHDLFDGPFTSGQRHPDKLSSRP